MSDVPATMPAAVFMGLRDVAVEDRPTPDARARASCCSR